MSHSSVASFSSSGQKAKKIFFTLNNPEGQLDWPALKAKGLTYLLYQREKGAEGTVHFQGVFSLSVSTRLSALKKLPGLSRAHFEVVKSWDAAIAYCSKADTREAGPWTHGERGAVKRQGQRTDIEDVQKRLKDGESLSTIADDHFQLFLQYGRGLREYQAMQMKERTHAPAVWLFVGLSGWGKSRTARAIAEHIGSVYYVSQPKGSGLYWDGYAQQKTVVLDEMDGNVMTPTMFNRLCDHAPTTVAIHGGQVSFNSPLIILTSNYLPKYWWKNRKGDQVTQTMRRIQHIIFFGRTTVHPSVRYQNVHGVSDELPFDLLFGEN